MNSVKKMTIFLVPVLLLGCATRPSSIEPLLFQIQVTKACPVSS